MDSVYIHVYLGLSDRVVIPQAFTSHFPLTSHQATTSNVIACRSVSFIHPMTALSSRIQEPHHPQVHIIIFKSSSRGPSMFLTKFYLKMPKIQTSRLAFSLDSSIISFSLLITHNNKFSALQLSLLIEQAAVCLSLTLGWQCMPLGTHTTVKLSLSAPFWRFIWCCSCAFCSCSDTSTPVPGPPYF